jgi:hypothetical protein
VDTSAIFNADSGLRSVAQGTGSIRRHGYVRKKTRTFQGNSANSATGES